MPSVRDYISSISYFQGITEDELAYISTNSVIRKFTAGETLFHEGEPADGLWIVRDGHVKVFKLNPDGGEHILHLRGPGDTFNDISAFGGGDNPANAATLSHTSAVWLIPHAVITYVLTHNSQVALNVIRILSVRVRSLVSQIEELALYSVVVRLARFLLKQNEEPSLIGPGVTRTAIAAHINTTPQTISNLLPILQDAGAIQYDRQRIVIVNEQILRSIAML
jgi:CRP/FNR family transcriptional regulator